MAAEFPVSLHSAAVVLPEKRALVFSAQRRIPVSHLPVTAAQRPFSNNGTTRLSRQTAVCRPSALRPGAFCAQAVACAAPRPSFAYPSVANLRSPPLFTARSDGRVIGYYDASVSNRKDPIGYIPDSSSAALTVFRRQFMQCSAETVFEIPQTAAVGSPTMALLGLDLGAFCACA